MFSDREARDAQPAWYRVAPALAEEPPSAVARLIPDVAAALPEIGAGSARARDFNAFSMHAMASDPRALRMLLRASGLGIDRPVSQIVHDG